MIILVSGPLGDIYSNLEDKWYNLIDTIDSKVPISNYIDKIDSKIPSFILFLILIFIIILLLILPALLSLFQPTFNVNIFVVNEDGVPVDSARIEAYSLTDTDIYNTDSSGKLNFTTNLSEFEFLVTKDGYARELANFNGQENIIIQLNKITDEFGLKKSIFVDIVDEDGDTIIGADLKINCDLEVKNFYDQSSSGFNIETETICDTLELLASAYGFEDKSEIVSYNDERIIIELKRTDNFANVLFSINSLDGAENNVEIILENDFGINESFFTVGTGTVIAEIEEGNYNYSAELRGEIKTGTLSVYSGDYIEKSIFFDSSKIQVLDQKQIAFKLSDEEGTGISLVNVSAYDSNSVLIANNKRTNTEGKVIVKKINENSFDEDYYSILRPNGFAAKRVKVELKEEGEYQEVALDDEVYSLKVNVVNDEGDIEKGAIVELFFDGYNEKIDFKYTDSNGDVLFDDLSKGNYFISVYSFDRKSNNTKTVNVGGSDVIGTKIELVTGEGSLDLRFLNETGNFVEISGKLLIENNGEVTEENFISTRGRFSTNNYKVGSSISVIVDDSNFYKYKSNEFIISRAKHTKEIYLREIDAIPNNEEIQIFLKNVFSNNPKNQNFKSANRLYSGGTYYFQFEAILNNEYELPLIFNSNLLSDDLENQIVYHYGYSIDKSHLADKYYNISVISEAEDFTSIPFIVEIEIDENYEGNIKINYSALQADVESLVYEKEFTIGESFCISDCDIFGFDNYIIENGMQKAIKETGTKIYNDQDYKLRTVVRNFGQEDFKELKYISSIGKNYLDNLTFENDKNNISKDLVLGPLSYDTLDNYIVEPKENKIGNVKIEGELFKENSLLQNSGNKNEINLRLSTRQDILVVLKPDTIYEGENYPFVHIETRYKNGQKALTNWKLKEINNGIETIVTSGTTNNEGVDLFSLDASSLESGNELVLVAEDLNASNPGILNLIVEKNNIAFVEPESICINLKVDGIEVENKRDELFNIAMEANRTIEIINSCDVSKRIQIDTELVLSKKVFDLNANNSTNVIVTGKDYDGLLGVYPVSINLEDGSYSNTVDFFLNDEDNCFELEKGKFDFLSGNMISSKITNKCFVGRKDIYNPKLNISTTSATVDFKKQGVPETIDFNVYVIGSAIESLAQGSMFTSGFKFWSYDDNPANVKPVSASVASEPYFMEAFYKISEKNHYDGTTIERPYPENRNRDPQVPFIDIDKVEDESNTLGLKSKNNEYLSIINFAAGSLETGSEIRNFPARSLVKGMWWMPPVGQGLPDIYNEFSDLVEQSGIDLSTEEGISEAINNNPDIASMDGVSIENIPVINVPFKPAKQEIMLWDGPTENSNFLADQYQENFEIINDTFGTGHFRQDYGENSLTSIGWQANTSIYGGFDMATEERWMLNAPRWTGYRDGGGAGRIITYASRCTGEDANRCKIIQSNYLGGGKHFLHIFVDGEDRGNGWGNRAHTSEFILQRESARIVENFVERRGLHTEEISIVPIEKRIYDLGSYVGDASPTPEWIDIEEWPDGTEPGDGRMTNTGFWGVVDVHPNGFVLAEHMPRHNYEYGCVLDDQECRDSIDWSYDELPGNVRWEIRDPADPLVEYSPDGIMVYYIPQDTIPEGVRMFLKDGRIFAEYVGVNEIDSPDIDFNITNNNLIGSEYATLSVEDWTGESEKQKQEFRIKISGPDSFCTTKDIVDGSVITGSTGGEYVPRVMFNWEWNAISENQCDEDNAFYRYCDATQFNISLMKKLSKIENILSKNQRQLLPAETAFYAYLIKDNYSDKMLNDFYDYYTTNFASSSDSFVNTYSKFIYQNRLEYEIDNGAMPFGGLYKVELDLVGVDESTNTLFNENNPSVDVKVKLTPIRKAKNYNPFYETAFNASIITNNADYGTGVSGNLELNNTENISNTSSSFNNIEMKTNNTLTNLQKGHTLIFDNTLGWLYLYSSQPSPVAMTINSNTGRVSGEFKIEGSNSSNLSNTNDWYLSGSSIGGRSCVDFEQRASRWFTPNKSGDTFSIDFNGTKSGTIVLTSTIFTPEVQSDPLKIVSGNVRTTLNGTPASTNNNQVFLDYLTVRGENNFDNLEEIFNKIRSKEMCISNNYDEILNVWWNEEYLESIRNEITPSRYTC